MRADEPHRPASYRDVGRLLAADARAERIDDLAVRATAALEAVGIPSLLLRGPVMARWLYDDPGQRTYADVDLLVPEPAHPAAMQVIAGLGMTDVVGGMAESERPPHARAFASEAGGVDLHWTIRGVGAPAEALWHAFSAHAEPLELGAAGRVRMPGVPARLVTAALHAAQHGAVGAARQDLERAVARVDASAWEAGAALAQELQAAPWFALGLRAVPGGAEMLERLRFDVALDMAAAAKAQGRVPVLAGLVALERTEGTAARARLLAREAFPTASFMRNWSPLARRGPLGLAAAYATRPLWLARRLPAAYRAYRSAAGSVGRRPQD